jgi:hypothetical protein
MKKTLTFETLTDVRMFRGAGSPMSLFSFVSMERAAANERGAISEGGAKMS